MISRAKDLIFGYPDLAVGERLEVEREVLRDPYSLELPELSHLLEVGFPFNRFQLRWLTKYEHLAIWVRKEGNFPARHVEGIGPWVHIQRYAKRTGKLPIDRERALNRIQFIWEPEDHIWNKRYEQLVNNLKNGIPLSDHLRSWMSKVRARWTRLMPWQRKLLSRAGLVRNPLDKRAETNLLELEVIYKKQGNIEGLVIRLSHFVRRLRHLHQMGQLDAETKARCDRMGFVWSTNTQKEQEIFWNKRYAEAQAYVKQFPIEVPPPFEWENRELGKWVASQTKRWKTMSPERQELLKKIWVVAKHELEWDNRYLQAQALHIKLGPYRDRVYKDEDLSIKRWITRQRLIWDKLSERQRGLLQAIGLKKGGGQLGTLRRLKHALDQL